MIENKATLGGHPAGFTRAAPSDISGAMLTSVRPRPGPAAAAVALVLGLLSGCATLPFESSPVFSGIAQDLVWDTALEVVGREFPLTKLDRGKWRFETGWRESLQPMRFEGIRDRVEGQVLREEEGYRVELRVVKQRNETVEKPLERTKAEWGDDELDSATALILLQKIESILRPFVRERRSP